MILSHPPSPDARLALPAFHRAFRRAFFKGAAVSVPMLAVQAFVLAWCGQAAWALLPVSAILLIATAFTLVVYGADHRPVVVSALPFAFAIAYCLVMALGFGSAFGFQFLMVALLPLVLGWQRVGRVGRWTGALALCALALSIEFAGGGAFLVPGEAVVPYVRLFKAINLTSAFLLLAAFIRIVFDFRAEERQDQNAVTGASARPPSGLHERRRLTDAAIRPYLHFIEPDRVFSVIVLEIDHHAAITELFGHTAAEQVARQASALVIGKVRETDLVSRRGRNAFLIFLPETVEEEAHTVAERIRFSIAQAPLAAGEIAIRVTATLGVAQSASSADMTTAIAEAEKAAATGHAAGHNRTMLAGLL